RAGCAHALRARGHRVRANDDRVGNRHDLVDRQVPGVRVGAGGLGGGCRVDAERPALAAGLLDDVAADPADAGAVLVALGGGPLGGLLEGARRGPGVAPDNHVKIHRVLPWVRLTSRTYAFRGPRTSVLSP